MKYLRKLEIYTRGQRRKKELNYNFLTITREAIFNKMKKESDRYF